MPLTPDDTLPSLDAKVFPATAAWLAGLPEGLASYPECETAREYDDVLSRDYPLAARHPRLPASLAKAIRFETDKKGWVPDLYCLLHMHIVLDLYFKDEAAYLEQHLVWSRELIDHPLLRAATYCISPRLTMVALGAVWTRMSRGTSLTTREGPTPNSRYVTLSFPHHMYDAFNVEAVFVSIKATISQPKSRHPVRYEVTEISDTAGSCIFYW